ncbi:MAG: hypothetical protein EXS02_13725 [Planctomycetes bacterium]|nr:hypothetical protein [Planctomycetota bacterium]
MVADEDFLGIDCGGSQSRWSYLQKADHGALPQPVQLALNGVTGSAQALADVLRVAARGRCVTACVAAIAGAGDRALAQQLAILLPAHGITFPVAVVGDVLAAAAGALASGPGLLLWSGTGSFAIARGNDGALHRIGGRGYLLGDQGSGYDLVRRAAAAALMALDGMSPPTELSDALVQAFQAGSVARLGAKLQQLSTGAVAERLPVVIACVERGDMVAQEVLASGTDALCMIANAAVRQAEIEWRDLPVTFGGGVLASVATVRAMVADRLSMFGAARPVIAAELAAARGAALLAQAWHQREPPMCRWVTDVAL